MGRTKTTERKPTARRSPAAMIGHPAVRIKDASGTAKAAGLRPVLDPPGRAPRSQQPQGNAQAPVTPAHQYP